MISWLASIIQSFGKCIVECFIIVPFEECQNETSSSRALLEDFSNEFKSTSSYDMPTLSSPAPPSTAPMKIPIIDNSNKIMTYLADCKDDPIDAEMVKIDCSFTFVDPSSPLTTTMTLDNGWVAPQILSSPHPHAP
jgi:hypothetical protein